MDCSPRTSELSLGSVVTASYILYDRTFVKRLNKSRRNFCSRLGFVSRKSQSVTRNFFDAPNSRRAACLASDSGGVSVGFVGRRRRVSGHGQPDAGAAAGRARRHRSAAHRRELRGRRGTRGPRRAERGGRRIREEIHPRNDRQRRRAVRLRQRRPHRHLHPQRRGVGRRRARSVRVNRTVHASRTVRASGAARRPRISIATSAACGSRTSRHARDSRRQAGARASASATTTTTATATCSSPTTVRAGCGATAAAASPTSRSARGSRPPLAGTRAARSSTTTSMAASISSSPAISNSIARRFPSRARAATVSGKAFR